MKQVRSQAKHVKRHIVYIHATNKLDNVDSTGPILGLFCTQMNVFFMLTPNMATTS